MSDSSLNLGSTTESHQRQGRRPGWLKPGLWLVMLVLILGLTIAGSAGSDIKATTRAGQVVGKDGRAWPASTDFQFTGQGRILGGVGNTWLVSGVPIQVDEHTQIIGTLNAGDTVVLSGRILKSGVWLADRIGQADLQQPVFTFNGLLLSVESGAWRIGSSALAVNEQSEVDNELVVNDPVLATFTPLEIGTWLALKIEPFDEPWFEPTPALVIENDPPNSSNIELAVPGRIADDHLDGGGVNVSGDDDDDNGRSNRNSRHDDDDDNSNSRHDDDDNDNHRHGGDNDNDNSGNDDDDEDD